MRRSFAPILAALWITTAGVSFAQSQAPTGSSGVRTGIMARVTRGALRGTRLGDAEKAALNTVVVRHRPAIRFVASHAAAQAGALRAARQRNDTAAAHAARKALRADRAKIAATLRVYLTAVRPALAPANRRRFDGNRERVRLLIQAWRQHPPV
jgi:hypothetical protein